MKSLEELGISPMPWKAEDAMTSYPIKSYFVRCNHCYRIATGLTESDVRLVAAAPELYEALSRIVEEIEPCIGQDANGLAVYLCEAARIKDAIKDAKSILAKAGGEEAENGN